MRRRLAISYVLLLVLVLAALEVPLAIALLDLPRGARVLELGCGPGATLSALGSLLAPTRLVGVDTDPSLISIARERLPDVELVVADARALPFDDASFDVVVDFGTCYHIARAGDALAEAARVLVPGGSFVTETKLNQTISHPWRSLGRSLPWSAAPTLRPQDRTLMWERRVKSAEAPSLRTIADLALLPLVHGGTWHLRPGRLVYAADTLAVLARRLYASRHGSTARGRDRRPR